MTLQRLVFALIATAVPINTVHAELTMGMLKERRVAELLDRDTQRARDQWQTFVMYVAGVRDVYQLNLYDRVIKVVDNDDRLRLLLQAEKCTQVDAEVLLIRALAAANRPTDAPEASAPLAGWIRDWFDNNCRSVLSVIE